MRFLVFIFCLFSIFNGFAQSGKITIDTDPRIDSLLMKQTAINKTKDGVSGYRIQIKNTTTQKDANNLRARFSRDFP